MIYCFVFADSNLPNLELNLSLFFKNSTNLPIPHVGGPGLHSPKELQMPPAAPFTICYGI